MLCQTCLLQCIFGQLLGRGRTMRHVARGLHTALLCSQRLWLEMCTHPGGAPWKCEVLFRDEGFRQQLTSDNSCSGLTIRADTVSDRLNFI